MALLGRGQLKLRGYDHSKQLHLLRLFFNYIMTIGVKNIKEHGKENQNITKQNQSLSSIAHYAKDKEG